MDSAFSLAKMETKRKKGDSFRYRYRIPHFSCWEKSDVFGGDLSRSDLKTSKDVSEIYVRDFLWAKNLLGRVCPILWPKKHPFFRCINLLGAGSIVVEVFGHERRAWPAAGRCGGVFIATSTGSQTMEWLCDSFQKCPFLSCQGKLCREVVDILLETTFC